MIYRSRNGEPFRPIGVQRPGVERFCDYTGDEHMTAAYRVTARTSWLRESPPSAEVRAATHPMTDDELLTMVQEAGFRYHREVAEPHSGMTRENTPGDDDIVAVGASGFGAMAIVVAADRGFITHPRRSHACCGSPIFSPPPIIITALGRIFSAAARGAEFRYSTCTTTGPIWSRPLS